jgi:hypothetical protein
MNNDGWEEDTDARWYGRFIDDPRRYVNSFPVDIRPINTPASLIAVAVMPTPSLLVTAVVMSSITFMVISAEGRHHVYTADHCS